MEKKEGTIRGQVPERRGLFRCRYICLGIDIPKGVIAVGQWDILSTAKPSHLVNQTTGHLRSHAVPGERCGKPQILLPDLSRGSKEG